MKMENKMVDLCIMKEKDKVDIDRVVKGAPWTFHNHLVVFNRLEDKEDPIWEISLDCLRNMTLSRSVGRLTNICRRELDESDMGWDMSLCAVGGRVATMGSIWLRKGNKGGSSEDVFPNRLSRGVLKLIL
ncbi:hypothetical protein Goshw_027364 [Gossypium schwendimanii]|uniref:DUF4283 domain-containing protein n=1 Tax=Gossypium schwendimanii TaxID=34291 RepID=A0A7J9M801_GOSSC|nr:hypothetical protein [Gossypium schwendimanii]